MFQGIVDLKIQDLSSGSELAMDPWDDATNPIIH